MILEALVKHYEQLESDPDSEVAAFGYSTQKIGACIVLNRDGTLFSVDPLSDESSGKSRPVSMLLPHPGGKRTSGIAPYFLWDKTAYVFGRDLKEEAKGEAKIERLLQQFVAFRNLHEQFKLICDHPALDTVCNYLATYDPRNHHAVLDFETISGSNVVFKIRGESQYVHEVPAIRQAWIDSLARDDKAPVSRCLITGEERPIARTHPPIKGVSDPGGQAEKSIVSFNLTAFDSFGADQSYNAPVSERAAFQYTTALNHLLADRQHRVQLGDTTVVFWTEPTQGAPQGATGSASGHDSENPPDPADALAEAFGIYREDKPAPADDESTRSALQDFLNRYRQGKADPAAGKLDDADAPFYVLGLSPNAARISVRFWMSCTVKELAERLNKHAEDLRMIGSRDGQPSPDLRQLLLNTGREAKDIPPQLAGEYARAILHTRAYPLAFANAVLRRIVADRTINHARAAGLKAWLIRNHQREITMSLDTNRTDEAYVLGRLFAAYERLQSDAFGGSLNRTIRDSYLASASTTPAAIFPRLYKLSQHHLGKLRRSKPGLAVIREKLIGEICGHLSQFPGRLSLPDQGLFAIGYYHQTQDFFTKKESPTQSTPDSEEN